MLIGENKKVISRVLHQQFWKGNLYLVTALIKVHKYTVFGEHVLKYAQPFFWDGLKTSSFQFVHIKKDLHLNEMIDITLFNINFHWDVCRNINT